MPASGLPIAEGMGQAGRPVLLEVNASLQLNRALVGLRHDGYGREVGRERIGFGRAELGAVGEVKHFQADLEAGPLAEAEIALQGRVDAVGVVGAEAFDTSRKNAGLKCGWPARRYALEAGGVEPAVEAAWS